MLVATAAFILGVWVVRAARPKPELEALEAAEPELPVVPPAPAQAAPRARVTVPRIATALVFVALFFAGAALTAGAGDVTSTGDSTAADATTAASPGTDAPATDPAPAEPPTTTVSAPEAITASDPAPVPAPATTTDAAPATTPATTTEPEATTTTAETSTAETPAATTTDTAPQPPAPAPAPASADTTTAPAAAPVVDATTVPEAPKVAPAAPAAPADAPTAAPVVQAEIVPAAPAAAPAENAPSSQGTLADAPPAPVPFAAIPFDLALWEHDNPGSPVGAAAVALAMQYLGVPYRWGGADPATGLDCSGLTMLVYGQLGVRLPHYAAAQFAMFPKLDSSQLEPGDLVFFEPRTDGPGHVAIYAGGDRIIEAPHTGAYVWVGSLAADAASMGFVGAVRPYTIQLDSPRQLQSTKPAPAAPRAARPQRFVASALVRAL